MGLDDDFPIGKMLPFWDGHIARGSARCWAHFFMTIYIYISSYNVFAAVPPFSVHLGKQEWVDVIGCHSQNGHDTYFRTFLTFVFWLGDQTWILLNKFIGPKEGLLLG